MPFSDLVTVTTIILTHVDLLELRNWVFKFYYVVFLVLTTEKLDTYNSLL